MLTEYLELNGGGNIFVVDVRTTFRTLVLHFACHPFLSMHFSDYRF